MRKSKWRARDYKRHSRWPSAVSLAVSLTIILAGLTFAALQSQPAKLTGNTINTATVGLLLSTDGSNYSQSLPGFSFTGIVPGGGAVPSGGNTFYIRNNGEVPLALKLAVANAPTNPAGVDLNKVNIILTPTNGIAQSFSLQSLINANATGGLAVTAPKPLFVGNSASLTLKVSIDADALNAPSASLSNIEFAFTGIATQ